MHVMINLKGHTLERKLDDRIQVDSAGVEAVVADFVLQAHMLCVVAQKRAADRHKTAQR